MPLVQTLLLLTPFLFLFLPVVLMEQLGMGSCNPKNSQALASDLDTFRHLRRAPGRLSNYL